MKEHSEAPQEITAVLTGPPDPAFHTLPGVPHREGGSSSSNNNSSDSSNSSSSSSDTQQQEYLENCSSPFLSEYGNAAFAALSGFLNSAIAAGGAAAARAAAVPQRLASLAAAAGLPGAGDPEQQVQHQQQQVEEEQQQQHHLGLGTSIPWRCPFHHPQSRPRSPTTAAAAAAAAAAAGVGHRRGRLLQRGRGSSSSSRNRSSSRKGPQRRHRTLGWSAYSARPYSRPRQPQQQQQQGGLWFGDVSLNFSCPLCLAISLSAAARGRAVHALDTCVSVLQQKQQQQQSGDSEESDCFDSPQEGTPRHPYCGPPALNTGLQQEQQHLFPEQQQQQRLLEGSLFCTDSREAQQQQRRHRAFDIIISALLPRSLGSSSRDSPRPAGVATAAATKAATEAAEDGETPNSRRGQFVASLPSRALALAGAAAAAASAAAAAAAAAAPATLRRRHSSSNSSNSSSTRSRSSRCLAESSTAPHYAEYLAFHVEKWREGSFDHLEIEADNLLVDPLQARCTIM